MDFLEISSLLGGSLDAEQQSPPMGAKPRGGAEARLPSILLVDDDEFMLRMQAHMLRDMGYLAVSTACSAIQALEELQCGRTDVIICDLNMPNIDGIEFLHILDERRFRGSVIFLSGEGLRVMHTVQRLIRSKSLVVLGAVQKPASRGSLGAVLDGWKPFGEADAVADASHGVLSFSKAELHAAGRERQWVLHFQPKVDLRSGALSGVEALVRWAHPEHGLVYPDRFISAAEDCGAIDELTDFVLQEAMAQVGRWRAVGLQIPISVNLSMENLRTGDFPRRIATFVQQSRCSPHSIVLEVTESRLMGPTPTPLETLIRMRLLGFELSIDDFGTGHSSLAQLRDVPFSELKVDRSFVTGARENRVIRPILQGSIAIAAGMGMRSVAEGVECEDDWRLLQELGCDCAQGYFIGRPMVADQVPSWLRRWDVRKEGLVCSA